MELYVLNDSYEQIGIIDDYKSFIWSKRYSEFGDCELYIRACPEYMTLLDKGNYLIRNDDDMICRIEAVELDTDTEDGDYLIITGNDCRKILSQRIVWTQTNFSGTVENYIRKLITDNIVSPSITARRIDNFKLGASVGLTERIEQQATYDALDEKIIELCQTYGYGSKVTLDTDTGIFRFDLYVGLDRSYNQSVNDYVVFSSDFDNIISSIYKTDASEYKNVALVGGEGEGASRKRVTVGEYSGLSRYEVFVDAKSVSTDTEEGQTIDYDDALKSQGLEKLSEHRVTTSFDGEVEPNHSYKYKTDYQLGDIVQVRNDYGIEASARITEVIETWDDDGYSVIPTFEYVEV